MPKSPPANAEATRDAGGSSSELGRSPGEVNGNPLQYACLENPMDRGAWRVIVQGSQRVGHNLVTKQQQKITTSSFLSTLRKLNKQACECAL